MTTTKTNSNNSSHPPKNRSGLETVRNWGVAFGAVVVLLVIANALFEYFIGGGTGSQFLDDWLSKNA